MLHPDHLESQKMDGNGSFLARAARWIAPFFVLKLILDALYIHFKKLDPVYDNIDYLDYAKQFKYAGNIKELFNLYITSFGHWRSPFQSVIIYILDFPFSVQYIRVIAYLIETFSILATVLSLSYLYESLISSQNRQRRGIHFFIICLFLVFCPLYIGLGRSTLVELPLSACIVAATALTIRVVRSWRRVDVILLNIVIALGILWKASFPLYYCMVAFGLLLYGIADGKLKTIFSSALFQIAVQILFVYNIANFTPIIDNARQVSALHIRPGDGVFEWLTKSVIGLPLVIFFLIIAGVRVFRFYRSKTAPVSWIESRNLAALIDNRGWMIFALYAINVILAALVHIFSAHVEPRYLVFVTPLVVLLVTFWKTTLNKTTLAIALAISAVLSLSEAAIYSVPFNLLDKIIHNNPGYRGELIGFCEYLDCFVSKTRANGVDGYNDVTGEPEHSPIPDRYNVQTIVSALKGKIAAGSDVALIGDNSFFNSQTIYYYLRDTAHAEGFYFNVISSSPDDKTSNGFMARLAAGKFSAVILRRHASEYNYTRYQLGPDVPLESTNGYDNVVSLLRTDGADLVFQQRIGPEELDVFVLGKPKT